MSNTDFVPTKLSYFSKKALALPPMFMLEHAGIKVEADIFEFDPEVWAVRKPTFPTGVVPVIYMKDGTTVIESGAVDRTVARATYNSGMGKDLSKSEMLYGLTLDLFHMGKEYLPFFVTIDQWSSEKLLKLDNEGRPKVLEHLMKFEQFLLPAGDRFTESGFSLGELKLFSQLVMMANSAMPEVAGGHLAAFYTRMSNIPAIKAVLDGSSQFGEMTLAFVPVPN